MQGMMIARAKELLQDGTVNRVLGWQAGEFVYDITPAVFETAEELDGITYSADNLPEDLATNMAQVLAAATAMSA